MSQKNEEEALEFLQQDFDKDFSAKPNIDGLPDALDGDGKPVFVIGDKVIIESYITFGKKRKYLHTRTYIVKEYNEQTGEVKLFDIDYNQSAFTNIFKLAKTGDVVKMFAVSFK